MEGGEWTCFPNCYLGFSKFWRFLKMKMTNKKVFFYKKIRIFKKRNICERPPYCVYVYKISSKYLENYRVLVYWRLKATLFHAVPWDFCIFLIFKFCQIWPFKKCSWIIFAFLMKEKLTLEMYYATQHKIFSLTFPWPRDFEWPWPCISLPKAEDDNLKCTRHD